MPNTVALISVKVVDTHDGVAAARLEVADGDIATGEFPVSDAAYFALGARVAIRAGYGDDQADTLFDGAVVKHAVQIVVPRGPRLVIECRGHAALPLSGRPVLTLTYGQDLVEFVAEMGEGDPHRAEISGPVRGNMRFQGSSRAKPGAALEVRGVGKRLSGTVVARTVTHDIADGQWSTQVEFDPTPQRPHTK